MMSAAHSQQSLQHSKQRKHSMSPRKQSYSALVSTESRRDAGFGLTRAAPPPRRREARVCSHCCCCLAGAGLVTAAWYDVYELSECLDLLEQRTHLGHGLRLLAASNDRRREGRELGRVHRAVVYGREGGGEQIRRGGDGASYLLISMGARRIFTSSTRSAINNSFHPGPQRRGFSRGGRQAGGCESSG
jgi:hypothetical protein